MSNKEGRKNPVIAELQLKEDIILVKSSQEVFGRPAKVSKKKKTVATQLSRSDDFSRSAPVLPYCSVEKGAGKELGDLIDRALPGESFKAKFGSDMTDTYFVKNEMSKRMKDLEHSKHALQSSIRPLDHMKTVLRMPNIVRTFHHMSRIIRRERLTKALTTWKSFILSHRDHESFLKNQKKHAAAVLQRFWRVSKARQELYARRKKIEMKDRRRSTHAVSKIETNYLKYKTVKEKRAAAAELMKGKSYLSAVLIQKIFRGWVARAWRVNCLRILLLKDLRAWADGNIQKLLDRQSKHINRIVIEMSQWIDKCVSILLGLQDVKTTHMLLRSIGITSIPPRPIRKQPKTATVRSCRKVSRHYCYLYEIE
jgi:hypothetical protein